MGNFINFNDYPIIRKLGEGGFGIVYLVEKDNKYYALKKYKNKLTKETIEKYKKYGKYFVKNK